MSATFLFQAVDGKVIDNERLAIALGLLTLVSAIAVFASCRICMIWLNRLGLQNPAHIKGYSFFYRYHLYYWWTFGVLLLAHVMVGTLHTGLPRIGDPDEGLHWAILGLGLFSAVSSISVFCSCRIMPRLMFLARRGKSGDNSGYRAFSRFHTYFWLFLACLVGAHFAFSYYHAGVWPSG